MSAAPKPLADSIDLPPPPGATWTQAAIEVAVIAAAWWVLAGGSPPEVNEAHYLAKAKHYWDPAWCAGDFFLESADAHLVFYWAFGWVTRFVSLPTAAWIGRTVVVLLMAAAWQPLSWAIAPRPWFAIVSAVAFGVLMQWVPMAGEWVFGGIEAKGFAYALLLAGLGSLVRGEWRWVWLWMGAAAAFHVLVGGWGVIAAGVAWLATTTDRRASLVEILPYLVGGLLLSLPGVIPALALTWGQPPEIVAEANDLYVHQRLLHHLRFAGFPLWRIVYFLTGTIVWCGLALLPSAIFCYASGPYVTKEGKLEPTWWAPATEGEWRLRAFVAGALGIALVGFALDATFWLTDDRYRAGMIMRYYWYRLADAMVPLGLALGFVGLAARLEEEMDFDSSRRVLAAVLFIAIAGLFWSFNEQRQQPLPAADAQGGVASLDDWKKMCGWIARNTPEKARVLSPPYHYTFKWYAGRAEVVNWKDQPQDAAGIIDWWDRLVHLYSEPISPTQAKWRDSAGELSTAELQRASRELGYDFQYVIAETRFGPPKFTLRRVYPTADEPNATFHVYEMPR